MLLIALTEETDPCGALENAALDLIDASGLNKSDDEEFIIVAVGESDDDDGDVCGALFYGRTGCQDLPEVTFTVLVAEGHRRRGVATELVSELVYMRNRGWLDDGPWPQLRAWTVNPAMRDLLKDLDFHESGPDHMVLT